MKTDYVAWPAGRAFGTLAKAKAAANKLAREGEQGVYVENTSTGKTVYRPAKKNPAPKGKWIAAVAVRQNDDGSVSVKIPGTVKNSNGSRGVKRIARQWKAGVSRVASTGAKYRSTLKRKAASAAAARKNPLKKKYFIVVDGKRLPGLLYLSKTEADTVVRQLRKKHPLSTFKVDYKY